MTTITAAALAALAVTLGPPGAAPGATAASAADDPIPGVAEDAVVLGADRDGDGDPDEVEFHLEVVEVSEEVYPGEVVTFWVFAPVGEGMTPVARAPSPTLRVEEGDSVRIVMHNTHYFPHSVHLHGTIHPNEADGVPMFTEHPAVPGDSKTYAFVATNPGTHWYHCHVQPDVHVTMGLAGMLVIEPDRPANRFTHLVPGAGAMPDLSKAVAERYDREYSLVYAAVEDALHEIPARERDPRVIEKRMHRDYDSTQAKPDIFLLNGRAFPYSLRDTPIEVAPGERVKLRVLNTGEHPVHLHTHGHHFTVTHLDGYEVPEPARVVRDVVAIGPAQRVDLELAPGDDGHYAAGPGVWLMHDHAAFATANKGMNPGGGITAIVYEGFMGEDGLPKTAMALDRFFDPAYYRGEVPVFDPSIFNTDPLVYHFAAVAGDGGDGDGDGDGGHGGAPPQEGDGAAAELLHGGAARDRLVEAAAHDAEAAAPATSLTDMLEGHRMVAESCDEPTGFRRVEIEVGSRYAREGDVFGYEPRTLHAEPCEELEIVMHNPDGVRHSIMVPGLNPMFSLEFTGPGVQTASLVTPAEDVTLDIHCHIPSHEDAGMHGQLVVGDGGGGGDDDASGWQVAQADQAGEGMDHERMQQGEPAPHGQGAMPEQGGAMQHGAAGGELHQGVGVVVAVEPGQNMLVVDHEEIPGFMAPMVMGYPVASPELLQGLEAGDAIEFTVDAAQNAIVDLQPRGE